MHDPLAPRSLALAVSLCCALMFTTACGDDDGGSGETSLPSVDAGDTSGMTADTGAPDTGAPDTDMGDGGDDVDTDTPDNQPPTVELLSPMEGAVVSVTREVTVRARVSDDRDAPADLTITLESDLDGALAFEGPDAEGVVTATVSLSEGTHVISASVTDTEGGTFGGSITIFVVGDAPPLVTIVAPLAGETVQEGGGVLRARFEDDNDAPGDLVVTARSDVNGELIISRPTATGISNVPLDDLTAGEHTVTVTATDSEGGTSEASVTFNVDGNAIPTVAFTEPMDGAMYPPGARFTVSLP